jgi:hypothetical protein
MYFLNLLLWLFKLIGYKCSICGENILTVPKRFEKGGDMYVGKIVETYIQGQNILATVHVFFFSKFQRLDFIC